jgi:hypothetical protein
LKSSTHENPETFYGLLRSVIADDLHYMHADWIRHHNAACGTTALRSTSIYIANEIWFVRAFQVLPVGNLSVPAVSIFAAIGSNSNVGLH